MMLLKKLQWILIFSNLFNENENPPTQQTFQSTRPRSLGATLRKPKIWTRLGKWSRTFLEAQFMENQYPSKQDIIDIAEEMELDKSCVQS